MLPIAFSISYQIGSHLQLLTLKSCVVSYIMTTTKIGVRLGCVDRRNIFYAQYWMLPIAFSILYTKLAVICSCWL